MNKKTGIFAATYLAVASVWLGGHFGPGFATGVFSAQYYEKYGVIGLFMPLLAMLLTGSVMYFMVEYARSHGTTNYRFNIQADVDDFALWNRGLSVPELRKIFEAGKKGQPLSTLLK